MPVSMSVEEMAVLTETALISATRRVTCLKYCSGVMELRSLYTIRLKKDVIIIKNMILI